MKLLCAFLLLTVFLYNLVGVYPVTMWQQHELRQQAEARRRAALPDAALVRIAVARAAEQNTRPQWQETHEFRYRGQLYDVVRQRATHDSISYYCWHDRSEEKLLAGLREHVREYAYPNAGARKSAKKAFDYLSKISFLLPGSAVLAPIFAKRGKRRYHLYAAKACTRPLAVPFAPPRPAIFTRLA